MFVDTMIFFLEGSYLKTSTSLNLHLDILTTWLTPNHRNPPSQVDHQVISRAAKGFPARHNMWSPSRRGKPLALNVTSGTEEKTVIGTLVVFDSTVDLKKKMWCHFSLCGSLCSHLCLQWASHCHLWDPQHWAHERHAPKLGTWPWAEFGTRDPAKIWGGCICCLLCEYNLWDYLLFRINRINHWWIFATELGCNYVDIIPDLVVFSHNLSWKVHDSIWHGKNVFDLWNDLRSSVEIYHPWIPISLAFTKKHVHVMFEICTGKWCLL